MADIIDLVYRQHLLRAGKARFGDKTPIYQILADYTPVKDLSLYPSLYPSGIHPDAALNVESLESDQDLWFSQGHLPQKANLKDAIDLSYLEAALKRVDARR